MKNQIKQRSTARRSKEKRKRANAAQSHPSSATAPIALNVNLEGILQTIPHPLLVLDPELLVHFANRAYCETFRVNEGETLGRFVYELGNHQWDITELRELLKGVIPQATAVVDFVVEHQFDQLGQRAMQLNACRLLCDGGHSDQILLAIDDISGRKTFEEGLRLRDQAIRSTGNGVIVVDARQPDRPIVFVNAAFEKTTGYSADEVVGRNPRFLQRDDRDQPDVPALRAAIKEGREVHAVVRNYRKDGTMFWNELTISPVHDGAGTLTHFVGIQNDVSKRILAEEALQERELRLRAIVNTASDAIITIDQHGVIESFNPGAAQMFGYEAKEAIGQNVKILVPQPYRDERIANFQNADQPTTMFIGREVIGCRKDGSTFPIDVVVSEMDDSQRLVAIIRDISDHIALQKNVLEIAEQEQRRIGQELHDGTGQQLIGLGFLLDDLAESLTAKSLPEATITRRICEELGEALKHVKLLSRGLLPVELDSNGLVTALNELAARISEMHGMHCTFECGKPMPWLENLDATNLYRIAQEAVANSLEHAKAKHILITLGSEHNATKLTILDDGAGMLKKAKRGAGAGLKIMKYRAELIGGTLHIGPAEAGGTLVCCTLVGGSENDKRTEEAGS